MLAQAQECCYLKSINQSHKIVARVSRQVALYYESILGKNDFPNLEQIKAKVSYFNAISQYRKSKEDFANGHYGLELGRLVYAKSFMIKTKPLTDRSFKSDFEDLESILISEIARSTKDNDLIYMEAVPEPSNLPVIQPANLVKPTASTDLTALADQGHIDAKPLFQTLSPFYIHQAASIYSAKKDDLVRCLEQKLNDLTQECKRTLSELGLPESVDAGSSNNGAPKKFLEFSNELRSLGIYFIQFVIYNAYRRSQFIILNEKFQRINFPNMRKYNNTNPIIIRTRTEYR